MNGAVSPFGYFNSLENNKHIMTKKNQVVNIIRWVIVLPSAVFAYFVVGALLVFLGAMILPDTTFGVYFLAIIANLGSGYAFVFGGLKVAPSHHKTVVTVLASVVLVMAVVFTFFNVQYQEFKAIFGTVFMLLGAIVMAVEFYGKDLP